VFGQFSRKEVYDVKLAVPFELRIFLVVVLVAIISMLVILDTPVREQEQFTSQVIQGLQQPQEQTDTVIISGIDVGQAIGFKTPTISAENNLLCLQDRKITTDRGRATAKYFLSLYDATNGGCTFEFAETEDRKTGAFMRCRSSQKAFDFTISFEPSLDSDIDDDDELEDIREETISILGMPYTIVEAKVNTGAGDIELRLIGPTGTIDLGDNYADTEFSDDVRVNGKRAMEGFVRIRASASDDEFRIQSIEYRLMPKPKVGKDVFVGDHQGLKQFLATPEAVWGDFDILFKVGSAPGKVSTPRAPISTRYGGNVIAFDAVGDDTYNMIFTNNQGRTYKFPVVSVVGGSLAYGDDDQDFEFSGAGMVVDEHDIFAVTSKATRTGVTNILEYRSIDFANGNLYLQDRAGGEIVGHFDTTTGEGTFIASGTEYDIDVDTASPHSFAVDFDNSGAVGGEAEIVTAGGPRIDLAGGFSGALEIDSTLFAESSSGETINFAFSEDNGDVDAAITSGVTLIKNDVSGFNEGLSTFGAFVQLGDRTSANDLIFNMPGSMGPTGGAVADVTGDVVNTGQLQGTVLVTCERSEFVKRAQAAKK